MLKKYLFITIFILAIAFPASLVAAPSCTDAASTNLCNPLDSNNPNFPKGVDTFTEFVIFVLGVFGGTAGIASVLYITFAGFRFLLSQGNEERVTKAKNTIMWTSLGLVLMLVSYALVRAIEKAIDYRGVPDREQIDNPTEIENFVDLYQTLIEGFFAIMALVAILMILISGYRYVTSAGNEETATDAKKTLTYAVLGVVISLLAYIIVHAIGAAFGEN